MRKLIPYHQNEIVKITHWLNDLAQEGYCVETWGSFFVKLKEEVEHYRYQIDIDDSVAEPNYERKLELEKQGWQYVQTIGTSRHHIYRTKEQREAFLWRADYIEKYRKNLLTNMIGVAVLSILYVVLCLWITVFCSGAYFWLNLVENIGNNEQLLILLIICLVYDRSKEAVGIYRLRRCLKTEMLQIEQNEVQDGMRKGLPYGLRQIIGVAAVICLVVLGFNLENEGENFEGAELALACLDLQVLEEDGFEISQITWNDEPGVNFGNRILKKQGLFAECHYEVNQYGTDATGKDVQITTNYFKLRPDSLVDKVLEELVDRSTAYMYEHHYGDENKKLPEDYWTMSEIGGTGFTKLLTAEAEQEDAPLLIFAQIEDVVIYVRYYGQLPAEKFVEELIRLYM